MKSLAKLTFICLFLISGYTSIHAQNTAKISIQGTLKDANGAAVDDGTYSVEFRLYDVETGGTIKWSETATVESSGGIYSHYLGSIVPLDATVFDQTLFLGIKIGAYELIPRTELTYAPYTFASNTALSAVKVICSGAVGDVKYSILNPTQFAAVNGDCWVPMTGGSMAGSVLSNILGTSNIPDAGGLFIRAQETPGGNDHDPDRTPTSPIANFEDQATQTHQHQVNLNTTTNGSHTHGVVFRLHHGTADIADLGGFVPGNSNLNLNTGNFMIGASDRLSEGTIHNFEVGNSGNHNHTVNGNTGNNTGFSGQETRPKNLNLYIYIRIN